MDTRAKLPAVEFGEDGYLPDEQVEEYIDGVMELFAASPEGGRVTDACGGVGWAVMVMDYGLRYLGIDLKKTCSRDLEEILLGIVPRQASCDPEDAAGIVAQLRAFWRFLEREFDLRFGKDCLVMLDDPLLVDVLEAELSDPANYGVAKSFVMAGRKAGFDMTTPDGIAAFVAIHNESMIRESDRRDEGERLGAPVRAAARPTIRRRDPFDKNLLDRLGRTGERLRQRLRIEITAYGEAAVKPLSKLIGGGGWGELHAIRLIRELGAKDAVGPLIGLLLECETETLAHEEASQTLAGLGAFVIEPLLQAWDAAENEEQRRTLASVLSRTPGPREDVREAIERILPESPVEGCCLLAEYADPAALDALSEVLDEQEVDGETPAPFGNQAIVEAAAAIRDLGGELTASQQAKVRAVDAITHAWRRSIAGQPVEAAPRPGRNEPCWCGSGRKYKRCHLREEESLPT